MDAGIGIVDAAHRLVGTKRRICRDEIGDALPVVIREPAAIRHSDLENARNFRLVGGDVARLLRGRGGLFRSGMRRNDGQRRAARCRFGR